MATRHLHFYRSGVDPEHYHHAPNRGILGNRDCPRRSAGVFVLEARQAKRRGNHVAASNFALPTYLVGVIPSFLARAHLTVGHTLV